MELTNELQKLLLLTLGPTGAATVAAIAVVWYVRRRIRMLDRLEARDRQVEQWRTLAVLKIRELVRERNRSTKNLHGLRNFVHALALQSGMKTLPDWEPAQVEQLDEPTSGVHDALPMEE